MVIRHRHYLPQAQSGPHLHAGPHWQVGAGAGLQLQVGWQRQGLQLQCSVMIWSFFRLAEMPNYRFISARA
jgi:hypothetical protein